MPRVSKSTENTSLPTYLYIIISDVVINDKTIALLIIMFANTRRVRKTE